MLDMQRFATDFIMYQSYLSWSEAQDDELFITAGKALTDGIEAFTAQKGTSVPYVYLNYADKGQAPLEGYGEVMGAFMKDVAERYDPRGVFQWLMPGGFKVSGLGG